MRRVLAAIMAMIMLMTSVPVLAEGSASASSAKKSGSTIDTTVSLAESVGFEPTYAEFIRTGHIYSDEALKKPVGQASRGDVVYALNRKEFGSSKVRVRVCWVSGGKEQIGWIKASFLRLMSDEQSRAYVQKVRGNAKVVRTDGRYLLPIAAYKQTSSSSTQSSSTSAKPNYTVTLDKSAGFKPAYAVFTRTGHIYSDEDMKNPVGQAYNGDVVYALTRKDYGTDKARVRVAWVSGGKEQIGWIKASFLRLMSSEQGKEYVNGVTGNAKVVRTDGRYLLPIAAYKANSGSAPATTKAPTVTSEPEKKPETEDRATHPSSTLYTPITTSKGLQLWWKPVADANNYQIWRSTKPTSGFTRLAVIRGANNWLDTTAKRNTVYYYQVRCGFTDGTVTTSATYGHWNDWGPTITQSRNSTTGVVTLSWGARTGAVKYAVYRAPAGSSTYSYVSIQTGLSYVDKNVTNGQTYSYYILASYKTSDGKTVTGSKGAAVNVSYGVQPVSSVTATGVAGGIKLTWPAAANAVGYRVLYRAGTSGNFTQIGTTNASTRTFTHRAPAYGKEIQYVVRSEGRVNGAAVLAAYTYATTAAVGIPTLTLKAGDGVINASWTACSGANAYKIYYKHESDTEFSGATLTDRSMAIPAVKAGKYQVYVRGVYNAPSGKVYNGTSSAISTFTAAGVDLSDIPVMTVSGGDNQLNVSWDKVDGATYYMVKVTGNGETRSYKYAGSQLSAVIPVNAGDYTVSMYAIFPDGDGRSCASQTVTVTGETLAAPALTVSKGEAYNTVQFVWEPVTGADAYVLTVTGNGQTFTYEGSECITTQTLAGEGSYTIKLRARKNITPDAQQPLWLESAATAMTESFTWADEVKYTPVITSLTLDDEPNWINVRWSEVPENDEYIVTAVGENSAWKITQTTASALIRLPVNGDETVTVTVTASLEDGRTFDSEAKTIHTQWADMVVLTAPVVTLTAGEPDNVKATWAAIPGATKYIVAVDGKEPFEATHTEVALTAAEGETVAVTVQAVCELATNNYAYGAKSGKVSLKCSWIPVVTLALSDTPNVMTISWDEVPGATSYEVVLNGEDGITYDRSCADTSVQIAVNGGVTYTASVYAVFPTAADSAKGYSQSVEAAWDDMVVLTAPNVTMAVTGVGYVTISWDEVPGADRYEVLTGDQSEPHVVTGTSLIIPAEEDATCWAIVAAERETPAGFFAGPIGSATLENVDWTPVLEVYLSSEANIVEMHWTELDADHGFVVEVTINGVTSEYTTHNAYYSVVANGGDTVSARVAALDVNGMPVVWSTVQTVTAQWDDMVTLTAPVATAAWNDETQQVTVTWSAVPGADSYRVYQGTESDGEGKYASVSETAELSYTFTVEPGCAYKYMVQAACDVNGKTLVGPAGSDVWVAAVDPTVAPANVQADTSRANYVTFSWDACYGAVKYGYTIDGIEPLQLRATTDTSVTVFLPDYGAEKKFRVWAEYSAEGDVQSEESAIFFTPVWDEPAIDLPEPQFTVQLSDETGYLLFAWEDIPDATSYTVLANCFDGETPLSFTQENITGNSVKLLVEEGYEYFVTMQAHYVHQETGESFTHTNNSAQLTVDADWPMPAPVVSIDMTEANIFNVVWDAVPGATSYDVKVERCLNGVWQPYNSLNGLTTTSRWFAANGDGSEYRFSVRAIGVGEVSDWTITTAYATWEDGINLTARTVTAENVGYDETTGLVDVRLTWEGEADATGYLVSYRPGTAAYESEWVRNNSGTCTLQLQEGVEYTIVVCGYFELEGYSTPHYGKDSEALKHTPAFDPDAMGMPTNVTVVASETPNYVTVNWSVVEGAEWYTVMVGNDDFLFDQPNVSMPVPCNGTYAVKVCAWTDDPENHGPWSDPVTITTNWADSLELTPPVVTVDTSVTNVITVRWSAIEDASKYLFRIEKKVDGEYKWVESIHTEATNYSFSANNDGTEYRFIVFAKGVHPVTSEELMSDSGRATGVASWENGIYLAAPAGELDTSVPNLLQVTWNEVEGADEYWLTVEQEDRNGVWIELDDHYEGEGTEFACVVNGDGSRYRFTLRSVVIDAETGDALFSENGMEDVEFIASWEDGVCLTPRELTFELTGYDAETEDVLVTVSWENEPGASSYSLRYDSRTGGIGWNTVDDGSGQCVMEWINGATYEIRIDGSIAVEGYDEKTVTYSETFVYTVDYDPYAISNLAVDMSTPNMFHLTWDEAPAGGYYCVYAEKLVDGEYVLVGEAYPGETAYWYSANSDGAEYRFTVYMVISDDGEGNLTLSEGSSVTAAATWTDGVTLDTPVLRMTDCETWGATRNVTFAWDVDPDATSYLVEYARKGDSVLRRFSSSGTITLALDAGIEYTVRVKAEYNSDDIWFYSELSNAVTYPTFADAATLPAPNARVITSTPNEFRIEWSAVEEATNGYCVSVEKADENGRFVTERCYYMTATYDLFLTNGDGSQYRFNVFALSQDADGNQLISANGLDGTVYTATWADGVNLTARTLNIESTGYRDDGMVEVTATWENEEDAVSYELYYWNDNGDAGYEYCDDGSGAIRFWMTEGETYNFWLRGYFKMYTSYISGPISETVTFTPEYEHDDPVTMGSLSMDMSTPNVFALGWDAVPGASEYTVQVDKLVDGAYVQQGIWPVTTNSFTYEANNDGATYRFTVWAAVEDPDTGVTTTTDSVSMDAVATWEGGVRLIAPVLRMTGEEQGAHDSYYNVTFQWDVDPAADGYIVAYSGGAEPWRYTTLTDGTGTITLDCSRGYPHDVRVQAYMLDENGDKITSAYSNTVTWPTISAAIAAPEAVMDLSEPNMIEVTWEPVTGAEEYWVTFEEMNEDGLYCVWYTYVLRDINPVPHAINGNGTMHRASVRAVRTDSATGKKIISENGLNPCEFEATWENGVILTPRTLHFTANSYNEETDLVEVLVSWDYEPGVTRYDLSYYTYDENGDVIEDGYAQITDGGSSYGFELKKGVEYEFSVRGYCKLSSGWSFYGPGSEVFTYVPAYGVDTLGVPEITLSIDEDGYVLVEWDDDPNAFSYTVYCSQSENTQAFDETYVDAWDDDGNRVTSYRFIPESREYAVKVCANWEENGEILHGDCGETKYINPMPDAPANLTATQSETPNYMTVTWDAVENATSYCVTVIDAGDYRIFDVPADTTSLTVLVSSGNRTGVTIFAWREYTGHRICSEMVETSVTCTWDGGVAVVAPASVKAELGAQDGEVIVTWDAVPGVTSYLVHPDAQSWGGDGVDVTVSGDETTCTLIVPQEAWFETATIHVASCLSDGTENGYVWSGTTAAEPLSLAFCDAPEVELTFTDNGETLSVAWEQAPEASGYRIYYRIRGEEAYTCTEAGADESSMTIAVQPCQVYEVYMTTVCTSQSLQEAESAAGEVQSIYTFDNGWYELIPDVTFAPGGETTVTWEAVEDAAGYNVRYAATEDPTDANTFHVAADEATSLTFALPVGETYDIEVEAYIEHTDGDDTWTYCLASGSTTVTVENVPALAAPEVIVETAEYGTQLWFYWEPVADAAGYNIYFSKRGDDTLYRSRMAADRTEAGFLVDPNCVYDAYMTTVGLDEEGIEFESLPSEKQSVYTFALGEGSEISLDVIAAYDGDVILYWDAVPGATGYDVSYTNANKSGDAGAVTLGADATSARFTLTVGQEYNLKVTAYAKHTEGTDTWQHKIADGCGNAVAKNGATVTLDVPTMTVSCGKEGYISISWTKVPNATRHGVYLYNVTQDKWASVFPERRITSWDFPVTEGDTYKMYVRGIYDHGDGTVFYGTSCLIQTVVANTGVGTYRALLIGNTYPGEGDTYLPGPDADARAMKSMLATMTGTPYTATVKTNLTASGMTSAIASAFAGATANDVSLLFYSGHGVYSEETEYLGALYGTGSTMLTINQLRAALDQIPGKKIVIMDSCHSGAAIGKSVTISSSGYTAVQNLSNAFNSAVISAFASRSKANLATSDYYVMTASHSTEESQSVTWNGTDYVGLFAYAMMKGCGYDSRNSASISSLYADTNGDKQISLAEAYAYGYANAKTYNSNQNAQVYPTGSSFVLWGR